LDNNLIMILVNRQVEVRRMPLYKERLTVETTVYECKGAFGVRNTCIYDEAHTICLASWATGAFVDRQTARPFRLPAEIAGGIVIDPKIEMNYAGRRIDLPGAEGEKFPPMPVTLLDIDFNRHMNNGRYIKAAMGFLPDDFSIAGFRVEYKKPAAKGELLYPCVKTTGAGAIYILLTGADGNPYTVMEFQSQS
jgi:acyl-ACP thioesterase